MTLQSGNDLCLKVDGVLCIVLVNNDKPNDSLIDKMANLQNFLSPKINRGIKYKFSWLNSNSQDNFISALGVQKGTGPSVFIINPGKRRRYFMINGELEENNFKTVFDKLASGDLRFKMFSGNKFPDLV